MNLNNCAHRLSYLLAAILACTQFNLTAQSIHSVEGYAVDSLGQGIELASVLLLQEQDSVMAGFSITNPKGRFKINDVKEGNYILNITFLGYKDISRKIIVEDPLDVGEVIMTFTNQTLEDIVVSANHIPIKIKDDTIEYNAQAFKTRPADNVEALLKKLPGIEVEDDGTIMAHGEEVENVFVDGKDFFGNDPTIATKNLPANAIDDVQLYDQKSDMARFSGIDDGERAKSINLVLKEDKKAGYFGNATAGIGTDDRYTGKTNVNRFTKNTQLSAIGMVNNINEQGFSFRESMEFMGGLESLRGGRGNAVSSAGVPISSSLGKGFVNTWAGGLNYNLDVSKKVDIQSSYFYSGIENKINQELSRQNLGSRGGFNTNQTADLESQTNNHTVNSKIEAKIDSTQRILGRVSLGWNNANSTSQSFSDNFTEAGNLVSGGIYDNSATGDNKNANLSMTYMKKLAKSGRIISINGGWSIRDRDDLGFLNTINTRVRDNILFPDTLRQEQDQTNLQHNYNFGFSFTEPLASGKYLSLSASRRNNKNDFDKDFYDLLNDNDVRELNGELSNNYKRNYSYNRVGVNYKVNKSKSNLTAGFNLQHSDLQGQLRDEGIDVSQDFIFLLPSLIYDYQLSSSRRFSLRYRTSVSEPSLEQLQPLIDNSDPLNIYIGNPDLQPSYRHNLNLNYNSYSQFSGVGLFLRGNMTYTNNSITNTRTIDEFFVQTTTPINTDYSFNSSLNVNFNAPLRFIKQNLRLSGSISYSDNILFVNQVENNAKRLSERFRLSFTNWKQDVIEVEIGTRVGLNNTSYSGDSNLNQSYVDLEYFTNIDVDFKKDWTLSTSFRHKTYSTEDFGGDADITRIEASISKVFLKSKKLRAELKAFDILNQNRNITRTSNVNYIEDERIKSIGRYFMVSLSYSFSGFGTSQSSGRGGRGGGFRGR